MSSAVPPLVNLAASAVLDQMIGNDAKDVAKRLLAHDTPALVSQLVQDEAGKRELRCQLGCYTDIFGVVKRDADSRVVAFRECEFPAFHDTDCWPVISVLSELLEQDKWHETVRAAWDASVRDGVPFVAPGELGKLGAFADVEVDQPHGCVVLDVHGAVSLVGHWRLRTELREWMAEDLGYDSDDDEYNADHLGPLASQEHIAWDIAERARNDTHADYLFQTNETTDADGEPLPVVPPPFPRPWMTIVI